MVESSNQTNGAATTKVLSPVKLAHVVLRTNNFEAMCDYYTQFLGGYIVHKNPGLSFITYDDEHHRIALINIPEIQDKVRPSNGLEHIAFTFATLPDLFTAYTQRKALGMNPVWCVNHGPTISLYYKDPDGNLIETQFDNFEDNADATAFMETPAFAANPLGEDFDPEVMLKRVMSGESVDSLRKRADVGPRGIETIPKSYLE